MIEDKDSETVPSGGKSYTFESVDMALVCIIPLWNCK